MTIKKYLSLSLFALSIFVLSGCGATSMDSTNTANNPNQVVAPEMDNKQGGKTLVTVAEESGNFPTLLAAVESAELVDALNGNGPFTVFAPTEQAFADLLSDLDVTAEELLANKQLLTSVLLYHVLPGTYTSDDVVALTQPTDFATLGGPQVRIDASSNGPMINESMIVQTDISAANGVIHVIDKVLLPPM